MKIGIGMTAWRRPGYFAQVIDALSGNPGVSDYQFVLSIDGGYPDSQQRMAKLWHEHNQHTDFWSGDSEGYFGNFKVISHPTLQHPKRQGNDHQKILEQKSINGKPLSLLLLQPHKVGSISLMNSLCNVYPQPFIVHHHGIKEELAEPERSSNSQDPIGDVNKKFKRLYWQWQKGQIHLKIISSVREPVSRNISAFFHFEGRELIKNCPDISVEELTDRFLTAKSSRKRYDRWYKSQLLNLFGLDVFGEKMTDTGWVTYRGKNVELLMYRLELDDQKIETVVRDFVGIERFRLEKHNQTADLAYGDLYTRFKKSVQLPDDYVEDVQSSQYFQHFYAE